MLTKKSCSLTTTTSSTSPWKVKSGHIVRQGEVIGHVINDDSTTTKGEKKRN